MLPETRNSHLAGKRERRKARKRLLRIEQRKQATQMNAHISPPKPHRRSALGKPLSQTDRDTIVGAIGRIGRDRVVADLMRLDPNRERHSATTIIRQLHRDSAHRCASTTLNLMMRLARYYRGGDQATLPLTPPAVQRQAPPAAPPAALAVTQQPLDVMNAQTISTIVISVLQALGHGPAQAQPPQLQAAENLPLVPARHGAIKQFAEMNEAGQMNILHAMHSRYGDVLKSQGVLSGEHRAAWRVSYDAYEKETGNHVQERASAQGDVTGVRVTPCEFIRADGDLVRFYEIVRKTWNR